MKENDKFRIVLGFTTMFLFSNSLFVLGYFLAKSIFNLTGKPIEIIAFIVSCVTGQLLFILVALIISNTPIGKKHIKDQHLLIDNTIETLNKIAQGDFNVFIPINDRNQHNQIAISVNKMAKELGTMENLRQEFISNVSHEIGSPLTSIIGFAQLLKNNNLTIEDRNHYLNIIESESKRLSKLSDNLLRLSTLESETLVLSFNEFSLDKQIKSIILLMEPQWKEKELNINVDLQKVTINGDENLLFQVWSNLLNNAIKFTPRKGNISIALTQDEQYIKYEISDNGIGIPLEEQIHIFERFYKGDKSRDRSIGGNGLGLSIVKKIVELHNGKINLKSKLKNETVFTVLLRKRR